MRDRTYVIFVALFCVIFINIIVSINNSNHPNNIKIDTNIAKAQVHSNIINGPEYTGPFPNKEEEERFWEDYRTWWLTTQIPILYNELFDD